MEIFKLITTIKHNIKTELIIKNELIGKKITNELISKKIKMKLVNWLLYIPIFWCVLPLIYGHFPTTSMPLFQLKCYVSE